MRCVATIKIWAKQRDELLELFDIYLQACQYASDTAFKHKCGHKFELHHLIYKKIRKRFGLKSQFAINAIAKGFESYKSCKKKAVFKSVPVKFDRRTFTFAFDKVRLTTNNERINIPISIPEYYWKYLDWRYQTLEIIKDRKDRLFFHITFSREVNKPTSNGKVVGIDLGLNNLAVTSDNRVFSGYKAKIRQFKYLRSELQAKGTKSAKRLLRKQSGRWKRYMAWVNHNVSKEIIGSGDTFVLEDLKGIRKNRNKFCKSKRLNFWLNSWSFYQLQSFIRYKSERCGKRVIYVPAYNTSKTCSNCGEFGSRFLNSFVCLHCGFECDSDLNASFNLRRLHVTHPNVSVDDVKGLSAIATDIRDNQLPKA